MTISDKHIDVYKAWRSDWNKFARDVMHVELDKEQRDILEAVQYNSKVSVTSGTSRGKDFVSAVAAICFLYLTPKFNSKGELIANTKVAMTAPTDRQIGNIMYPEVTRLFNKAKVLPGRLSGYDIRTEWEEWFLTGFKADKNNEEAWSGFHAVNTMFIVTEASGIQEKIWNAIEGNLQNNSRLLIVFNPNTSVGYAAKSQKSPQWKKFRLDSLHAENVLKKEMVIPGQVDYKWVNDKVEAWCEIISEGQFSESEGDFIWEGKTYRPNDLFRIKVRGMFPKVNEDVLVPLLWIELANERWKKKQAENFIPTEPLRLGSDVAGMGTDSSVFCHRFGNYVSKFEGFNSGGNADHMKVAGIIKNYILGTKGKAFIDTIGEGAGVYSRLIELKLNNVFSCKFSENAEGLTDITKVFKFVNMRAYLFWAVRDWLNPDNKNDVCLPPCDELTEELTEIRYKFQSNGSIIIEAKDDIKKRLGRSPDYADTLANTFYPHDKIKVAQNLTGFFH